MSKLPEYADWKAPWEKTGDEFDAEKAKRFIYGLHGQLESANEKIATVSGERDEFKTKVDEAAREGENETQRLQRELQETKDKLANVPDTSVDVLRLEVALDKNLTSTQAKRLIGTTKEELEADADELVASFGGSGKADDDDGAPKGPPKRQPKRVTSAGDPDPDGDDDIDVDKALDSIPRL